MPAHALDALFECASVLFLGPADTPCARAVDTARYDVVVITNHMVTLFDRPAQRVVLLCNTYYSTSHRDDVVAHSSRLSGVLCTNPNVAPALGNVLRSDLPVRGAPKPRHENGKPLSTLPLGLVFFLQYVRELKCVRSLDIVGVTMYEGGTGSYVRGYELLPLNHRHCGKINRAYIDAAVQRASPPIALDKCMHLRILGLRGRLHRFCAVDIAAIATLARERRCTAIAARTVEWADSVDLLRVCDSAHWNEAASRHALLPALVLSQPTTVADVKELARVQRSCAMHAAVCAGLSPSRQLAALTRGVEPVEGRFDICVDATACHDAASTAALCDALRAQHPHALHILIAGGRMAQCDGIRTSWPGAAVHVGASLVELPMHAAINEVVQWHVSERAAVFVGVASSSFSELVASLRAERENGQTWRCEPGGRLVQWCREVCEY